METDTGHGSDSPSGGAHGVRRAIVFDDDAAIGKVLVARLRQLSFEAKSVVDVRGFISALESSPHLILLDLSLGETDAIELFELLQEKKVEGHVILMSGHSAAVLDHARRLGQAAGISIVGALHKPFHQRDLREIIANIEKTATPTRAPPLESHSPDLLHEALTYNWIEFWYQPKIELRGGCTVGAESLARIRHPKRGILTPDTFLRFASDDDLSEMTMRALDMALQSSGTLHHLGRPITLSINVAARTFTRTGLIDEIKSLRGRRRESMPIILELTESDLLDDKVAAAAFATRAILHGFQISIDDFGHGYATFERLRNMPFTELKIERAMVHGCARDPALLSICSAALQLAHGFGAKAVAEGVEHADDLAAIRSLGFDMAQGYMFSRPVPFEEFVELPAKFLGSKVA